MRIYPINNKYVFTIDNNVMFRGTFQECINYFKSIKTRLIKLNKC